MNFRGREATPGKVVNRVDNRLMKRATDLDEHAIDIKDQNFRTRLSSCFARTHSILPTLGLWPACRITAQHSQKRSQFSKVSEGLLSGGCIRTTEKIHVESIFPRPTAPRTRLYFRQAHVAQRKYGKAPKQRSRNIVGREDDRSFIRLGAAAHRGAHQKKARKVAAVVFYIASQNSRAICRCSCASGDARGIAPALLHQGLHAPRSVVCGHRAQ